MLWFRKEEWKLVSTHLHSVQWTDVDNLIETVYYYLYESNKGNRKFEVKDYGYCKSYNRWKIAKIYLNTIYPWSVGKNFENIPSYFDVCKDERKAYIKLLYKTIIDKKTIRKIK